MIISKWIDTKENEKAILDLCRRVYSRSDIINSSYFDWQYRKNSQGKAIIMLGLNEEQNNSVIGIASVISFWVLWHVMLPFILILECVVIFQNYFHPCLATY